jgi:hypothetical protein
MNPKRYQLEEQNGEYFAYDTQQDTFVNRHKNPVEEGFFTKSEAKAVVNHLNKNT